MLPAQTAQTTTNLRQTVSCKAQMQEQQHVCGCSRSNIFVDAWAATCLWVHWQQQITCARQAHRLKINRGTLEGTTFWFAREGHQRKGHARSDLVLILKQQQRLETAEQLRTIATDCHLLAVQAPLIEHLPNFELRLQLRHIEVVQLAH